MTEAQMEAIQRILYNEAQSDSHFARLAVDLGNELFPKPREDADDRLLWFRVYQRVRSLDERKEAR